MSLPPAIVRMPAEIDLANSGAASQELSRVIATGARIVIADLTGTAYCDAAGLRALLTSHDQAAARSAQLRFAIAPSGAVRRVVDLTGLHRVLAVYPTVAAAVADGTSAR